MAPKRHVQIQKTISVSDFNKEICAHTQGVCQGGQAELLNHFLTQSIVSLEQVSYKFMSQISQTN